MPFSLVPIPPPAGSVADLYPELVSGDSSLFTATVGTWVNSGGTQTLDGTRSMFQLTGSSNSLKLATTAVNQYTELALGGTFLSGKMYSAVVAIWYVPGTTATADWLIRFGDIAAADYKEHAHNEAVTAWAAGFHLYQLLWVPTADRSAVKIRVGRGASATGTADIYLGYARAARMKDNDPLHHSVSASRSAVYGQGALYLPGSTSGAATVYGPKGAYLSFDEGAALADQWNDSSIFLYTAYGPLLFGGARGLDGSAITPSRRSQLGVNFEPGPDFPGMWFSERDPTTIEVYPDYDDFDIILLDGSADSDTKHWWHEEADGAYNAGVGRLSRIGSYFQIALRKAGALAVAADVCEHFQLPFPAEIDEVRVHVGTAPTGSSAIFDVNVNGTTIFGTSGNRPSIAASGTDDTSGAPDVATYAKDAVLSVDVDQIGSTITGSDLTAFVRGRWVW